MRAASAGTSGGRGGRARGPRRGALLVASVAASAVALGIACTVPLEGTTGLEDDLEDPIGRYLARSLPDSAVVRAALERIEESTGLVEEERWEEAHALLAEALRALPSLDDWTPILLAELSAGAGDTASVRRQLELAEGTDASRSMATRWGWLLTVEAHEKSGDVSEAARLAQARAEGSEEAADGGAPERGTAARAWFRTGELALAAGDSARARTALARAMAVFPRSSHALDAARLIEELGDLDPRERYLAGRTWHAHGNWERALDGLRGRLNDDAVGEEERHALRFDVGRALFHLARYREAEAHLRPLTPDSVSAAVAAEALFWTGRAQYRQGRQVEGRATLERVAELHPGNRHAVEALLLIADLEEGAGRIAEARALHERAFGEGLRSPDTDLRAVRMGSSAYLAGDYRFAAESFDRYRLGSERNASRQQAAFWAALAHERLGNREEAEARFLEVWEIDPLTYYGAQAGERLDLEILPAALPLGPEGSTPQASEALGLPLRNALLRLEVHRRATLPGSFAFEHERQKAHFGRAEDRGYGYAEALILNGFEIQGILLGREFQRAEGGWNLRLLRIVYPFPYRETILRESRARGLDPFFVAGLIRQESMFRPDIQSPAGAVGLMQIMPATGRQLASRAGVSRFTPAVLEDPEVNIRMGTDFLATMLNRFEGRIPDALSAYNAGPTRIRRWQGLPEYGDPDVFVEHIPFRETRDYVKIVQQNTRIYAALYGCEDFSSCRGVPYRSISARAGVSAEERDRDDSDGR